MSAKKVGPVVLITTGYEKKNKVKEAFAIIVKYVAGAFIFVVDDKYFINAGTYGTDEEAKGLVKKIIKANPNIEMNIE